MIREPLDGAVQDAGGGGGGLVVVCFRVGDARVVVDDSAHRFVVEAVCLVRRGLGPRQSILHGLASEKRSTHRFTVARTPESEPRPH